MVELIKIETELTPTEVIEKIKLLAPDFNFIIRDIFNMATEFKHHNIHIEDGFEYYSIMICNPQKAYTSINANKIRGAVLLPPKQIVAYKDNDKTVIAYMKVTKEDINKMLPSDEKLQNGLDESGSKIIELISQLGK